MAEKVVSVRLRANVEGFTAGMAKARKSVDDLTKADVPKAAKGFENLSNKAALAGAAIAVGLGVAVKRFAEFDKAMSAVKANSGATGTQLESLRAAALKLGADSQFSAKEAAEGINELAKAGVQTRDILGGGLKGALDLAAAGQISVAEAAETTATALTQFKLGGDQAVHVADLLANGANKAQGGVSDLGAALKQAGLVAAATGLSVDETATALTAFASAGLIGSDAGTSLKTMLQRLSAPVGAAATEMEKIGLSAYDSAGNFVGLANVAGQLQEKLGDLTPEARNAAMATIFGSDAVRASTILYEQGAEGIRAWNEEVSEQGAAAKQAADLTDNLTGDIERLGGAFDSVLIQTGGGANDSLRTLVQGLQGVVETIGKVPGPLLLVGAGLASLALIAPKAIRSFRDFSADLKAIGANGPRAAKGVDLMTGAVKAYAKAMAAAAAIGVANELLTQDAGALGANQLTKDLVGATDAVDAFSQEIKANAAYISATEDSLTSFADVVQVAFDPSFFQEFNGKGSTALKTISFGMVDLNNVSAEAAQRMGDLDGVLSGLVTSGNVDEANRLFNEFAATAKKGGVSTDEFKKMLPGFSEGLAGVDNAASTAATSEGKLAEATEAVQVTAEDAKKALDDLRSAIEGLGSPLAAQRAAERDFQQAIADSAERLTKRAELQKQLKDAETEPTKTKADRKAKADEIARITAELEGYTLGFEVNTQAGRDNQATLDNIRTTTLAKVQADFDAAGGLDNLTASTKAGEAAMKTGREAFIKAADAAGLTLAQATLLADQLKLIPDEVGIIVSQTGAAQAAAEIDAAARDRSALITIRTRHADFKAGQENEANALHRAGGGPIYGAGTGTSDSIPAWLSNGEHVWTAAEVAKLGGQSAMYALRNAVRNGNLPQFATGGAVQYAPPVQYMAGGPTSYATTHDSSLNAQSVTIVTQDASSFKREIRTAPYRAKARPGR